MSEYYCASSKTRYRNKRFLSSVLALPSSLLSIRASQIQTCWGSICPLICTKFRFSHMVWHFKLLEIIYGMMRAKIILYVQHNVYSIVHSRYCKNHSNFLTKTQTMAFIYADKKVSNEYVL